MLIVINVVIILIAIFNFKNLNYINASTTSIVMVVVR